MRRTDSRHGEFQMKVSTLHMEAADCHCHRGRTDEEFIASTLSGSGGDEDDETS